VPNAYNVLNKSTLGEKKCEVNQQKNCNVFKTVISAKAKKFENPYMIYFQNYISLDLSFAHRTPI